MTGTFTCPPVISENLCAWLAICSKTRNSSDGIWNSITGRSPHSAAPVAMLVNACSEIGVSVTRSVPKRLASPRVSWAIPAPMSSPSTHTAGSRSSSSASARLRALA